MDDTPACSAINGALPPPTTVMPPPPPTVMTPPPTTAVMPAPPPMVTSPPITAAAPVPVAHLVGLIRQVERAVLCDMFAASKAVVLIWRILCFDGARNSLCEFRCGDGRATGRRKRSEIQHASYQGTAINLCHLICSWPLAPGHTKHGTTETFRWIHDTTILRFGERRASTI
jgi:hypothetical protein